MTTRRSLVLIVFLANLGGCRMLSNSPSSVFCTNEVNPNMMAATAQQEHKFSENEEVFFVLKNATMCSAMSPIPNSFYIRGRVHNGQFVPESTVLGEGEFEVIGQNGWLEIKIGKFYPAHTAQAPISPYVEGHMTDYGFVPSRREIK